MTDPDLHLHGVGRDRYVQVLVEIPARSLEHPFTYHLPEELMGKVTPGMRVTVPFGPRTVRGVVVDLVSSASVETKPVKKLIDSPPLSPFSLSLASWLSHRYLAPLSECLSLFPLPLSSSRRLTQRENPGMENRPDGRCLSRQETVSQGASPPPTISLFPSQERAVRAIVASVEASSPEIFLLHGVTGSGKTQVFLEAARAARKLSPGHQALVLVPEISLSYLVAERFVQEFGSDVVLLHSARSQGERKRELLRLLNGEAWIVVGARSALFSPFKNLGLIVIDEEHDPSYKQDASPRYVTREVAFQLAQFHRCPVILGSATPSMESYHQASAGAYTLLSLAERAGERPLPPVQVVDMREADRSASKMLSLPLLEAMKEALSGGEQVILFLNRRGYAPFVQCRDCGKSLSCPRCAISLTLHRTPLSSTHPGGILLCHYCGYWRLPPDLCEGCGSRRIFMKGTGTQRIQEEVQGLFPRETVLRLDKDTTSRRGSHETILSAFSRREARILVGTQMVGKGFDFPEVSVVGIVNADVTLHLPDFRASERTFQLLTQVAGRCGRGEIPGNVVLQTRFPDHPVIMAAKDHDFLTFYEAELAWREELRYPPFSSLVNLVFRGKDAEKVKAAACEAGNLIGLDDERDPDILGPAPCPFFQLQGYYRWHLVLKGEEKGTLELARWAQGEISRSKILGKVVQLVVDVNPMSLL